MIMVSLSILNCAIHRACNFIMGREMHLCRFGPGWFRRARLLKNAFAKQQLVNDWERAHNFRLKAWLQFVLNHGTLSLTRLWVSWQQWPKTSVMSLGRSIRASVSLSSITDPDWSSPVLRPLFLMLFGT